MPGNSHTIPDFTGRVVGGGRYQMLQLLGAGGYGVVYRAVDHKVTGGDAKSSQRAIKIMRKVGLSQRERTNIRRELGLHRIVSKDPNVVTLHHAFEDDKYVFMVMDFISGGDLFTKVAEEGVFFRNDDLVKQLFVQILDAVHGCHRKHIFHRDLKPENILCSEDGHSVYLADFGMATSHRESESFGCGSMSYMSPECIGEECDYMPYSTRHSDIWALGIILINMISSRSPWEHATTRDDFFHDFIVDEDFLLEVLPISEGANDILKRIFELEPRDRITIPELRTAILNLDTFFMTEEEIAKAPRMVVLCAEDLDAMRKAPGKVGIAGAQQRAGPRDDTPVTSPAASPNATPRSTVAVIPLDSVSEASTEDSEGPLTPEVHAVEPAIEVPDLCEEQDLGDAALLHEPPFTKHTYELRPLRVVNELEAVVV